MWSAWVKWMRWGIGVWAAAAVACREEALDPSDEAVASVEIAPASAIVAVGGSALFTATPLDAAGNALAGRKVLWVSADPNFATVSNDGVVTGRFVGTVPIAASIEGKSGTAHVIVIPIPVTVVRVSPPSRDLTVGQSAQLIAEALDARGTVLPGRAVTWSSNRPNVAAVSTSGVVTGHGVGAALITATVEGQSAAAAITVSAAAVASVIVSPSSVTLIIGQSAQLQAQPRSATGQPLSRPVTWSSSAPNVATVTSNGLVTALSPGTATISASSEGRTGTSSVRVELAPVARVDVTPADLGIRTGQAAQLTAWVYDARDNIATGHVVTWTSSDTKVATVDNTGRVRGERQGTVTITATAGGKSGTARVRVQN